MSCVVDKSRPRANELAEGNVGDRGRDQSEKREMCGSDYASEMCLE